MSRPSRAAIFAKGQLPILFSRERETDGTVKGSNTLPASFGGPRLGAPARHLHVLADGEERSVAPRKQRTLIGSLAMRVGPHSRDVLAAELWPDNNGERGRQRLRHALYKINAVVRAELIAATANALRIADGVSVDLRELERAVATGDLRGAVSLYAGDLCPEIEGVDGEAERVRLRGLCASAGEALAVGLTNEPREAEATARRVIEVDPFRPSERSSILRRD